VELQISKIDPLLCNFEMPLEAVYYPLGFTLEIATNSAGILSAAEESWAHFRKAFPGRTLRMRIGVVGSESKLCPPEPVCREQRNILARVADAANWSVSDLSNGFAFAWLTQAAVEHRPYLRWHFIEGMTWDLLGSWYITSVHAACVKRGEHGVLLCGDSGVGKSMLSYACARHGWTFLSDDSCCLVRGRKDRLVIGNPYQIRFRESAIAMFPELKHHRRTSHNGELAIEVATAGRSEIETTLSCSVDYILFLNRGDFSSPRLVPFSKNKALQWFEQIISDGLAEIRDAHKAALQNLLGAEILELQYNDLLSAVELLEELLVDAGRPLLGSTNTWPTPNNA
jgi:hypothetical protein